MAIAEINENGGILGQCIKPIVEDGASDPALFETKARKLVERDTVNTIFGCWTSASRKAVLPVVEQFNTLLWYPVQYEGLECSRNIFYTGSCPNQQVEPAVTWLLKNKGKRFYLLGSNYVFPRTANKIITSQLKQQGGMVVGEEYVSLGIREFTDIITRIKQARPDVVFNTLNGDSNLAFYHQYKASGITAAEIPIMAASVAEAELQNIGETAVGHYACWSYFQSLNTPHNREFVQKFQARYGADRVTSDPIEAAYSQVYLWKQAVEQAQSFDVERVRVAAYGQSFEAPGGFVRIEPNHHVWKACRIGQILPTGQFDIIYTSDNPIKPLPWLGVEEVNFTRSDVVIELLAEVSQGIYQSLRWERKSRELQATKTQLLKEIAKRERVEAVLRDSEAALQRQLVAVEASMDGIALLNSEGEYIYLNEAHVKLLGYDSRSELVGKTWQELYYPDEIERLEQDIFPIVLQKRQWRGEAIAKKRDGSTFFQEVSLTLTDEGGFICVCRDITERKQAEKTLQQQKELLQTIFDHIPVMMALYDATGQLQLVNRELERVLGWSPEELENCDLLNECYPDSEYRQRVWDFMREPTGKWQDFKTRTRSGRVVDTSWANMRLSDGQSIGIGQDITERKQVEEALRISEERYRSVIAAVAEGIVLQQADGTITAWNEAAEQILGLSAEQMQGRTSADPRWRTIYEDGSAFPGELHPAMVTLRTGESQFNVVMGVHKSDGALIWILVNSQPLFHPEDTKPYAVVTSFSDITKRKQSEEALREAEERYRSIFENSDKGLFQATPDGRFLSVNPALARIYGYESPEALIENLINISQQLYVDPHRREEFLTLMQADDAVSNFESQAYRRDGRMIWILENTHVVRDAKGEVLYYEGSVVDITERKIWEQALRYQQECTEQLLLNILPEPIAQRLKLPEDTIADSFAEVTVLFADLVNFTEISTQIPPRKLVDLLNKIFSKFDALSEKHGLEKIKTIGDAYMVVGGLPTPKADHAEAIAEMALEMQQVITHIKRDDGKPFDLRIGINTGPVVAGVIGMKKFAYDLWGDAVNVASRMESHGVAGSIQVTEATYERLKDRYVFERRGAIEVKGKGEMITYWLKARKVCYLQD